MIYRRNQRPNERFKHHVSIDSITAQEFPTFHTPFSSQIVKFYLWNRERGNSE